MSSFIELVITAFLITAIGTTLLFLMAIIAEAELLLYPMRLILNVRDWIGDEMKRPFGNIITPLITWFASFIGVTLIMIVLFSGFIITVTEIAMLGFGIATAVNLLVWCWYWVEVGLSILWEDSLEQMNAGFAAAHGLHSAGQSIDISNDPLFHDVNKNLADQYKFMDIVLPPRTVTELDGRTIDGLEESPIKTEFLRTGNFPITNPYTPRSVNKHS